MAKAMNNRLKTEVYAEVILGNRDFRLDVFMKICQKILNGDYIPAYRAMNVGVYIHE